MSRPGAVTFKGTPLTLVGEAVKVGQPAPDFVTTEISGTGSARLSKWKGKPVLLVFYHPSSYTAAELPYIRVECCDTCQTYVKCIDLTKNGLAEPLVDELASVPLNLWAQEHGYAKLHPNLLGM